MRRLLIKFPSQIRISGWDFGSSARAMNQAGGKDELMTYESVSKTQADLEKVSKSTTERKSMSTKTTIKRIALVAVSALGLGLVTSVTPASAVGTEGDLSVSQVTTARLGAPVVVKVVLPFTTDSSAGADDTATIRVKLLTTAPGSSTLDGDNVLFHDWSANNLQSLPTIVPAAGGANAVNDTAITVDNSTSNDYNQILFTVGSATSVANSTQYMLTAYSSIVPDKAGTWNLVYWSDADGDGVLDAAEKTANISLVVSDTAISSVTVTSMGTAPTTASSTSNATAENGLMKISLKGADGLPALPTTTEYLTAKVTAGSMYLNKLNDASATYSQYVAGSTTAIGETGGSSVTSLNLNYYNFDLNGNAYVDVKDATEETSSLTVTVGGTSITGSANQAFVTASDDGSADGILCVVTSVAGCAESAATDPDFTIGVGSKSVKYYVGTTTAEGEVAVDVVDVIGLISGLIGANYSLVVTASDTAMTAAQVTAIGYSTSHYLGSFTVASASGTVTGGTYTVFAEGNAAAQTTTVAAGTATTGALYVNGVANTTIRAAKGSTNSYVFRCTDDLGARKANATVTVTLSGRNAGLVTLPTLVTNASGEATLTYTDASTSTTSVTDTLSFASGSCTKTGYITYTTDSTLGVSTVAWSAGGAYDESYAGATTHNIQADDDVSTGAQTVTFIVKDASGVALAGVPVTFTVDNGFIKKTSTVDYATQITGADGKVSTSIFATAPGKQTVTATSAGKTATGYVNWVQEEENDARSISAAVTGNKITFTVKDRLGNGVRYVDITVTTNDGWFGNGSTSTTPATDENGQAIVYLSGNTNEATVKGTLARASYPQAYDVAGEIAETAVTAATAGTTTGYGASSAAAGVGVASVSVNPDTKSTDSVDAANEATDAANAATDAANAAAEAADAATAAAQDAQAAVAELATQVAALIAGIKAQITTLTNLVIKIQKKVKA